MTNIDDIKSKEELASDMHIEIQALGINFDRSLGVLKLQMFMALVLGVIALVHFW